MNRRIDILIACIEVSLVMSFLAMTAAAQTKLQPPAISIPADYFGIHIHAASDHDWPSVPFGTWRLWDAKVTWLDLEPRKGEWDFRELDKDIALAQKHKVELILTLGMTPTWASEDPEKGPSKRRGSTAGPRNINDWRDYVRAVATRYKGKIHIYEIWNEPNGPDFYTGSFQEMVLLAREAYTILHKVDPSVTVISPSPSGSGLRFLDVYLHDGGGRYADVIGYHFYVSPNSPEAMVELIAKVKEIMARYGQSGKPLWDTEVGYFIQSQATHVEPGYMGVVLTADQAMAYVARAYILNWASGISRLCWYDWDSDIEGLGDFRGTIRKPAAEAYERMEQLLVGAVMTSCSSNAADVWVCSITRPGQYGGHFVWYPRGNHTFEIPAAWNARWEVSLSGPNRLVAGVKSTQIGPQPVLLENKIP